MMEGDDNQEHCYSRTEEDPGVDTKSSDELVVKYEGGEDSREERASELKHEAQTDGD